MAAFCGWVSCHSDAVLGLPELMLGLIPGAGGTLSITRRIGRWRTAYLVLSGRTLDPATALEWGLVDEVSSTGAA
jgi:enoyl-CoA hydratase/carnithine racemase